MRISDWSSDVCSSDLPHACANQAAVVVLRDRLGEQDTGCASFFDFDRYRQFIIQQGGLEEVDVHVAHHESQPGDRKSTRLNSSHQCASRMPSSACKKKHKQLKHKYTMSTYQDI